MFIRHRHDPPDKLNCPHAMGTNTVSPQWPKSFRHVLLLPSPSLVYSRRKLSNLRVSVGASASWFWTSGLRIRSHAGARSRAAQRTAAGHAGRCAEVAEARSIAAFERRCRAFLAKAVLRFQHSKLPSVCREVALYSPQIRWGRGCATPEGWQWSSFRHYATGTEGRVEIESEWTARKRDRAAGKTLPSG